MTDFKISELLFVYGTLLDPVNEFAVYLKNNSSHYRFGWFKGSLFDIGSYPGALYNEHVQTVVFGTIVQINAGKVLTSLDQYEGFGSGQTEPDEFVRKLTPVQTANGIVQCWAYLYNLPVTNLRKIESGNYLAP